MSIEIEPIINECALIAEGSMRVLVIADVHLGMEHELRSHGINIPSQSERLLNDALRCVELSEPDRIVLLGDVKHNIPGTRWQEGRDVAKFVSELSRRAPVDIVPGNHDGGIGKLLEGGLDGEIHVHGTRGMILDGVAYAHGHAWPEVEMFSSCGTKFRETAWSKAPRVSRNRRFRKTDGLPSVKCEYFVMGHSHPVVRLLDSLGRASINRVWLRARFDYDVLAEHYEHEELCRSDAVLTVMPAFNSLCGGLAFNESMRSSNLLGPLLTSGSVMLESAEVYTVDGLSLGSLGDLSKSPISQDLVKS